MMMTLLKNSFQPCPLWNHWAPFHQLEFQSGCTRRSCCSSPALVDNPLAWIAWWSPDFPASGKCSLSLTHTWIHQNVCTSTHPDPSKINLMRPCGHTCVNLAEGDEGYVGKGCDVGRHVHIVDPPELTKGGDYVIFCRPSGKVSQEHPLHYLDWMSRSISFIDHIPDHLDLLVSSWFWILVAFLWNLLLLWKAHGFMYFETKDQPISADEIRGMNINKTVQQMINFDVNETTQCWRDDPTNEMSNVDETIQPTRDVQRWRDGPTNRQPTWKGCSIRPNWGGSG